MIRFLFLLFIPFFVLSAEAIPFLKPSFMNLKEDLEDAKRENKFLFVMFHQEACPFCDKMRRTTFQDKRVQEYFTKHFYMVEIDIRGPNELVDFDGKKTTERQFALKHGVRLTPVFMFLDKEGNVIAKVPGYIEPQEFLLIGRYVVEGHYKNKNIVQFLKENKGK
jgi:thioredoxin-related protein